MADIKEFGERITGNLEKVIVGKSQSVEFIVIGLRLLHWGYSMNEELRTRKAQSDLRKQKGATSAGRP